jgi:hypothetical protein
MHLIGFLIVEMGQIHVAFREDVLDQDVFARGEAEFDRGKRDVPATPLPPRLGICRIEGGGDRQRPGGWLAKIE